MDGVTLASGSRDGALSLWRLYTTQASATESAAAAASADTSAAETIPTALENIATITPFATAASTAGVTALAFHPAQWLLLAGSAVGEMLLYQLQQQKELQVLYRVQPSHGGHSMTVTCLQWKPEERRGQGEVQSEESDSVVCWASAGEDHTVRIHQVAIHSSSA